MIKCIGCGRRIWFWQTGGFTTHWHLACKEAFTVGYQTARKFAQTFNRFKNYDDPWLQPSINTCATFSATTSEGIKADIRKM